MPNRILREGILTSEVVNKLRPEAELFYRRLMSIVDDYGRYFAHPALLRAACYPLRLDMTSEKQISGWLNEISEVGLVCIYGNESTKYLEIKGFRQRRRYDSKYPDLETVQKTVSRQADPHPDTPTPTPTPTPLGGSGGGEDFDRFWKAYPRKVKKKEALKSWAEIKPDRALLEKMLATLDWQCQSPDWTKDGGQYIPHPASWLNAGRWEDEPPKVCAKCKGTGFSGSSEAGFAIKCGCRKI